MSGKELFEVLVTNTGLPETYVRSRLSRLIASTGGNVENLTIDQVRDLLSDLLLDVINESLIDPS
jgi:hypothetical protein